MTTQNRKNEGEEEEINNSIPEQLAFDSIKQSFALDVEDENPDYDHPSDYDTVAEGATNDDSTYDNSNPFVGDEYANLEDLRLDNLNEAGLHIEGKIHIKKVDKLLAETPEDYRNDLDEEGYPKNDTEK